MEKLKREYTSTSMIGALLFQKAELRGNQQATQQLRDCYSKCQLTILLLKLYENIHRMASRAGERAAVSAEFLVMDAKVARGSINTIFHIH